MYKDHQNVILDQSIEFAIMVVKYCELLESRKKYVIARQLLKSGTSIGANIREAQNAESRADFIHKIKLAAKEAEETDYWLLICDRSASYPKSLKLSIAIREIIKILAKILTTAITNNRQ